MDALEDALEMNSRLLLIRILSADTSLSFDIISCCVQMLFSHLSPPHQSMYLTLYALCRATT